MWKFLNKFFSNKKNIVLFSVLILVLLFSSITIAKKGIFNIFADTKSATGSFDFRILDGVYKNLADFSSDSNKTGDIKVL
jgi:hypothetical protein